MKKTLLGVTFAILITVSCLLYSCKSQSNNSLQSQDTNGSSEGYISVIKDLENQIIEIRQSQYISDAEKNAEINRLKKLIEELKKSSLPKEDIDTPEGDITITPPQDTSQISKFTYETNGNTAIITGYSGSESSVAIPQSIDGYTITEISDDAFISDCITEIIIPNGITKIGWFAFKECSSLKKITVPSSVQSIGYAAFPNGNSEFTIICPGNSFVLEYAISYGINYTVA